MTDHQLLLYIVVVAVAIIVLVDLQRSTEAAVLAAGAIGCLWMMLRL